MLEDDKEQKRPETPKLGIYRVTIEETVSSTFDVEARSEEEAEELARQRYEDCTYVLEPGDVSQVMLSVERDDGQMGPWCPL